MCLVRYLLIVMMQGILSPFYCITDATVRLIDSCTNSVCSMMLHLDQFFIVKYFFVSAFSELCSFCKMISRI